MDTGAAPARVLVAVVCLGLLAGSAVIVRTVLETGCVVPRVVGLPLGTAIAALTEAGVGDASPQVRRRAGDAPEGTVTEQQATTCSRPVSLVVADGGPALAVEEVPQAYRELLGDDGLAGSAPVRLVTTTEGAAYKSDALLVGECPAVRVARGEVEDDEVLARCRPVLEQRLRDTVLRVTRTWWGEAPSGSSGLRSAVADSYWGTAWGARLRRDGWELRVDVTFSTGREEDRSAARHRAAASEADLAAVEAAALIVAKGSGTTAVEVLLVPEGTTPAPVPADLTQLRLLADEVLREAAER